MKWLDMKGFPCHSAGKESAYNAGDLDSIPGDITPVFWPGEFPGLYSPCSGKESDTTERTSLHLMQMYIMFPIFFKALHRNRKCLL